MFVFVCFLLPFSCQITAAAARTAETAGIATEDIDFYLFMHDAR